ncbi:MAG: hypothetical protein R2807_00960 [Chitinophagales bacterium]
MGTLQVQRKNIQHQIIPVVFITNETTNIKQKRNKEKLAENIRRKIALVIRQLPIKK